MEETGFVLYEGSCGDLARPPLRRAGDWLSEPQQAGICESPFTPLLTPMCIHAIMHAY